jgi:hypothetical protein
VIEHDLPTEDQKKILLGAFEESIEKIDLSEQAELPAVHQAPDPSSGRVLALPKGSGRRASLPTGNSQGISTGTRITMPQRTYTNRPSSPGGSSPGSPLTPIREEGLVLPGFERIDHEVKKAFEKDPHTAKLTLDAPLKAKITVSWELTRCLKRVLGDSSNLASTLTITGDPAKACAFPCEQYLNLTWNGVGMCVLEGLREALVKDGEWTGELVLA